MVLKVSLHSENLLPVHVALLVTPPNLDLSEHACAAACRLGQIITRPPSPSTIAPLHPFGSWQSPARRRGGGRFALHQLTEPMNPLMFSYNSTHAANSIHTSHLESLQGHFSSRPNLGYFQLQPQPPTRTPLDTASRVPKFWWKPHAESYAQERM